MWKKVNIRIQNHINKGIESWGILNKHNLDNIDAIIKYGEETR